MIPTVGQTVHYVSHGTPGGEYKSECRAAIITETNTSDTVGLCVLNPTGMLFNRTVTYHDGAETPGDPACEGLHAAGPLRYCACGWIEASYKGGTWHWPERTPTREHPIVVNIPGVSDANHADIGRQVVEAIKKYEGRGDNFA
ncbi:hypothetical protein AB0I81_22885 [Nonomuraea sp. NPDC050404]|uniref:hypothetical protein n=1 Tax=Nonomuraea sp. NPDC050404 TaxID=3155783 RepID=UPI0033D69E6E